MPVLSNDLIVYYEIRDLMPNPVPAKQHTEFIDLWAV